MQFAINSLRFEDIRQQVVDYLTEFGTYTAQFDFKGSNIAYIIDTMAYVTMMMSYNISHVANNIFLDTTEIRKNALSIAKTIGYRPVRKKSSILQGKIRYTGSGFNSGSTISISPRAIFAGTKYKFNFINLSSILLTYESPLSLVGEFTIYQGDFKFFSYPGNGEVLQSFVIPSKNVEESNLSLFVHPTAETINNTSAIYLWTEIKTFFDISQQDNNIFFVEEDIVNEYMPKIIFGNGTIGNLPSATETITVEYFETQGADGNGETSVSIPTNLLSDFVTSSIVGLEQANFSLEIASQVTSYGGTDNETLIQIQNNAPRFFSAAGRGVTKNDYMNVLNNFPEIDTVNVIGGDELYPGRHEYLGNIYICATPFLNSTFSLSPKIYFTEVEERSFFEKLKKIGIIATLKHFLKPSYVYINGDLYIEVSASLSASEINKIKGEVAINVNEYTSTALAEIGAKYRQSKIQSQADQTEGVISSEFLTTFNFPVNAEFFTDTKINFVYLPTNYSKNELGEYILDSYGMPVTTNFVKKNASIVAEKLPTDRIKGEAYTTLNLPPEESSLYGKLTYSYLDRYMYNFDYPITEAIEMIISPIFSYIPYTIYNSEGLRLDFIVTVISSNYEIRINGVYVATLNSAMDIIDENESNLDLFGLSSFGAHYFEVEEITAEKFKLYVLNDSTKYSNVMLWNKQPILQAKYTDTGDPSLTCPISPSIIPSNLFTWQYTNATGVDAGYYTINTFGVGISIAKLVEKFGTIYKGTVVGNSNPDTPTPIASNTITLNDVYRVSSSGYFKLTISSTDPTWLETDEWIIGGATNWAKCTDMFTLVILNEEQFNLAMDDIKVDRNLSVVGGLVYGSDHFHDRKIGTLNYDTGELIYEDIVDGFIDSFNNIRFTSTIKEIFNNDYSLTLMDFIRLLPDNEYVNGINIGQKENFDSRFNQKIIFNLNTVNVMTI